MLPGGSALSLTTPAGLLVRHRYVCPVNVNTDSYNVTVGDTFFPFPSVTQRAASELVHGCTALWLHLSLSSVVGPAYK
jgi:hypothetical protein